MRNRIYFHLTAALLSFGLAETAYAQLAFAAFSEASTAYTALTGLGSHFAASNPAVLADFQSSRRVALMLEASDGGIPSTFKNDLPDFTLRLRLIGRLSFGMVQSERGAVTQAAASRAERRGIPPTQLHPFESLHYIYRQKWSVGVAMPLKWGIDAGLAMRHQNYLTFASPIGVSTGQDYHTYDFGIKESGGSLRWGVVLRNLVHYRTSRAVGSVRIYEVENPDSLIAVWEPSGFPNIAHEPKLSMEIGFHWLAASHWQFLGDVTTRGEYALGMRWRVFSRLFTTLGTGGRYDRIYDAQKATYNSLGMQFQREDFAIGITWIVPTRSEKQSQVYLPYGHYSVSQWTSHQLLVALGVAL